MWLQFDHHPFEELMNTFVTVGSFESLLFFFDMYSIQRHQQNFILT